MLKSLKMISCIFHVIYIFYTVAASAGNTKDVNVKGIVNDLIENWEPPFSYLKSRGYLPEDLPSAPVLQDFQQMLEGNSGQELPIEKDSKRGLDKKGKKFDSRTYRSFDEEKNKDLKDMFRNLFSSQSENASKTLKSKLNVDWDMNALKSSAHQSAAEYLKGLEKKPVKQANPEEEPFSKQPQHKEPLDEEESFLKQPVAQDHLHKEPLALAQDEEESFLKQPVAQDHQHKEPLALAQDEEESFLKQPVARNHQHKEPLAQDDLLKRAVPFGSPKFHSDLPKVLKRLAMWRPRKNSKPKKQAKHFQN